MKSLPLFFYLSAAGTACLRHNAVRNTEVLSRQLCKTCTQNMAQHTASRLSVRLGLFKPNQTKPNNKDRSD